MTARDPTLSLRIDLPNGTRFGPGKAKLLLSLINSGSIKAAALELNMSYPRALKLIEQMNEAFAHPLIETKHGGTDGGGAYATELGKRVLALYDDICAASTQVNRDALQEIARLLAD